MKIHAKQISAFFLPALQPQEGAREIVYTYRWPEMTRKLLEKGIEVFKLMVLSLEQVRRVEYALFFAPELHRMSGLSCEVLLGSKYPGAVLKGASSDAGWEGWRYEVANVAADHTLECQIEVKTRRSGSDSATASPRR